eukprot:scpid85026/ scgid0143/ 
MALVATTECAPQSATDSAVPNRLPDRVEADRLFSVQYAWPYRQGLLPAKTAQHSPTSTAEFNRWTPVRRWVRLLARQPAPRDSAPIPTSSRLSMLESEEPSCEVEEATAVDAAATHHATKVKISMGNVTSNNEHELLRVQGKSSGHAPIPSRLLKTLHGRWRFQ